LVTEALLAYQQLKPWEIVSKFSVRTPRPWAMTLDAEFDLGKQLA
jgi:hypothetical protein